MGISFLTGYILRQDRQTNSFCSSFRLFLHAGQASILSKSLFNNLYTSPLDKNSTLTKGSVIEPAVYPLWSTPLKVGEFWSDECLARTVGDKVTPEIIRRYIISKAIRKGVGTTQIV